MLKTTIITGALILVIITLIVDLSFEPGVIHGVPFVVLISLSFWLPWHLAPPLLAFTGTLLVVARYLFLSNSSDTQTLFYNMAMETAVLWVMAFLIMAYRKSARSLEDREKRLKALIETAVDGVIIIDAQGSVQEFNPACERLFGYVAAEVLGNNVHMLMPAPYRQEHDHYLSRYRETGNRRIIGIGREVEGRRKDGSTFPLELSVGEARTGGKQVFVGIIRDVTARQAAELSLRIAKDQAESANRAKSVFLANMSHEIRTPMNAVLGYTQVLENDARLPRRYLQPLRAIRSAGNHLISLIDEILDLSKIEAGAMEIQPRGFDLRGLLDEVAEMTKIRCEQKQLAWQDDYAIQQTLVFGDDRKLRQVLINLLGNAVKFTDQGQIRLGVSQRGQQYRFEVEDTGPGISEEARELLFQPFQQAEAGKVKGGTGLGLVISMRQIQLMGGQLDLNTNLGEGSLFHFELELPAVASAEAESPSATVRHIMLSPHQQLRVLVVDDVKDNREVLSQLLVSAGMQTTQASTGKEALLKFEQADYDIVFMDIRMPVMDGMAALKTIRQRWPKRKLICIAITASGLLRHADYYLEAGFDDYLSKPFLFDKVCAAIKRHLAVEFTEQTSTSPSEPPRLPDVISDCRLAKTFVERLGHAAEINALSEIEAGIAKLRRLDEACGPLADRLADLASNYDMQGIMQLLEDLPVEPD
ncbi:MAG: PAS domain S-box protein [Gammaproteobacteria bacterium]|nr:PAS domain S-box protein [Gammaproteobacteria bacterium]